MRQSLDSAIQLLENFGDNDVRKAKYEQAYLAFGKMTSELQIPSPSPGPPTLFTPHF